jgi:phosphoribosylformylglycinamidine cyclo-ligase
MTDPEAGRHAYRQAGVDVKAGNSAVAMIKGLAEGATRPEVVGGLGGFAGSVDLGDGRVLVASTDGVGTKLEVARLARRLDTVGIDCVAMCANDVACTGAEPLFFLDYLAVGRVVPEDVAAIVGGVAEGCRRAGCALLGGETAEHPGTLEEGRFDLAGFCVGIARTDDLLGPHRVRAGDILVGLPSTGLHSNGYSLVRRVLLDAGRPLDQTVLELGRTLGEELLEPTAIYVEAVLSLARQGLAHAAAHITGGGWTENLPRALPEGLGARVDVGGWLPHPIFGVVAEAAGLRAEDLFGVLNMGIGMVVIVAAADADRAVDACSASGTDAVIVGEVVQGSGVSFAGVAKYPGAYEDRTE